MRKIYFLAVTALLLACGTTTAQDWKNALKKAATATVDKATDGKLTAMALVGTWHYTGPGVKFEGGDIASEVGGAALEGTVDKQLAKAYAMAGIKPGACTFAFLENKTFTATMGTHTLSGTYEFDASKHIITLHFAQGKTSLGSVPGHAYISGSNLNLVFPVTKLVAMIEGLGSKIPQLSTVVTMLEKYKNVYIGFAFSK